MPCKYSIFKKLRNMKKLALFVVLFLLFISANAQSPQAFKYQAIVRDATGEILSNQNVSFRIGIRDGSAVGTILYQETHATTTNQFGIANLEIGNGTPVTGIFADIDWGNNSKFLEVELDPYGGSAYTSMGTTQVLSVPYALYAENAGYSNDGDWTADSDTLYSAADSTVTIKDGKVGIGIINPDTKLHVAGNLKLEELSTGSLSDSLVTWDFADSTLKKIHASAINDTDWTISGNDMYAAVPGNVGIGTVSPVTLLHVNGRGAFGNTINSTKANRALNLVSTDAVMRIWRVTDATAFSPGVELIWGNQPNQGDEGNFWWDFYLDGLTGSFNIRDRSFGQGNETRMVIDTSGNVGIGTTNPDEKLHVAGALKIENMVAGSTSDSLVTWDPADSKLKVISYTGLSSDNDWTIDNDTLYSAADSTVTIKYGNVGIGTTTPVTPLHVYGRGAFGNTVNSTKANRALNLVSTDAVMRIWRVTDATAFSPGVELIWGNQPNQGDEGNFWWDFYLDGLTGSFNIRDRSFGQGNETRFAIDNAGNVGIGTINPDEKLHVAGALKIEDMVLGSLTDSLVTWDPADSTLKVISNSGFTGDNDWTIDADTLYSAVDSTVTIKYGNVGIGTTNPQRSLHISDVMRLEPRSSAPSDPSEGDLYINSTDHHIYCYLNGIWKQLD